MWKRHSRNLLKLKEKYDIAYEKALTDSDRERAVIKLMEIKMIKDGDSRLAALTRIKPYERDVRKNKMASFISKCPYLRCEKKITVPVKINPHDGERGYKEITWHVKYPETNTYVNLVEVAEIKSSAYILEHINKIISNNGCEWETAKHEDFAKLLLSGRWVVYNVQLKDLLSNNMFNCGYVFVEKVLKGESDENVSFKVKTIIDLKLIESKHVSANVVVYDVKDAVRKSIKFCEEHPEKFIEPKKEVKIKEVKAENTPKKEKVKKENTDSAESRAADAAALRAALGME